MDIVIAVDAMGCDAGPVAAVQGALQALKNPKITKIILVGDEKQITPVLSSTPHDAHRIQIIHTTEVIDVEEAPTVAIKTKKDSSMVVGLRLVKNGQASAFVSAGSTGALLTGATTIIGRIEGIKRPALGVLIPNTTKGHTFLVDGGANMDAKPEYLLQFAQMGSVYMQHIMNIDNPKIGLINVGLEREKGNALTKASYELLEESSLNFAGNVEAREMPLGAVDVAVCDGFVGNIILKYCEGYAKGIFAMIKRELKASFSSTLGGLLAKPAFKRIRNTFDYAEVGGAPFIGLKGLILKAHGSSNARAIESSIGQCARFIEADVINKIKNILGD